MVRLARHGQHACGDMRMPHDTRLEKIAACQHDSNVKQSPWQKRINFTCVVWQPFSTHIFKLFLDA